MSSTHISTPTDALTAKNTGTQATEAPVFPLPTTPQFDVKDRREYEHARQRALKPSDRVIKRIFKLPKRPEGNIGRGAKKHLINTGHNAIRYAPNPRWDAWIKKVDLVLYDDDVVDDVRGQLQFERAEDRAVAPRDPVRVSLDDLIKSPRKRKGIAHDYEIIPQLRPVMVMEETIADDSSSSEEELGWEMVPALNAKSAVRLLKTPRSYASVVSSSLAGANVSN